jgi:hypothetical protein
VTNAGGCSSTSSVCVSATTCGGGSGGCGNRTSSLTTTVKSGIEAVAYPNPFNTATTVEFKNLNESTTRGTVEVYSMDGRKIAELFNGDVEANTSYQVKWNAADVADGTYMYRVVCGENVSTGIIVLMKE